MAILRRFRKSLRLDKAPEVTPNLSPEEQVASFCQAGSQRTPQRNKFGSFSSATTAGAASDDLSSSSSCSDMSRMSWNNRPADYQRSDSGYSSYGYSSHHYSTNLEEYESPPSSPEQEHAADAHSVLSSFAPPRRQATYSSSVYSRYDDNDDDRDDGESTKTEAFPKLPVMVEDYDYNYHGSIDVETSNMSFDTPPRTNTGGSGSFKLQPSVPGKSRYARLNDLPAASPRASMFHFSDYEEDEHDIYNRRYNDDSGDEGRKQDSSSNGKEKSGRTRFTKSLSVSILPSHFRRPSLGGAAKTEVAQEEP